MPKPFNLNQMALRIAFEAFAEEETGQNLIEYVLLAALLALGAVTALKGFSTKTNAAFKSITKSFKKVA